jgi:hypothetical protein
MSDDDLPTPRRPRLTPAHEARLEPVDAKSRASYEDAEAALLTKNVAGEKLDELLALIDDDGGGGVPQAMLEMSDSTVHTLTNILHPPKPKPDGG